jgi:hypothetical protein
VGRRGLNARAAESGDTKAFYALAARMRASGEEVWSDLVSELPLASPKDEKRAEAHRRVLADARHREAMVTIWRALGDGDRNEPLTRRAIDELIPTYRIKNRAVPSGDAEVDREAEREFKLRQRSHHHMRVARLINAMVVFGLLDEQGEGFRKTISPTSKFDALMRAQLRHVAWEWKSATADEDEPGFVASRSATDEKG